MANQFYNSDTGVNWSNVGDAALGAGISAAATGGVGALFSIGGSLAKGLTSSYFNKKSEKRAWQRYLNQMAVEYDYAQRYAENSPSWTVKGLRDAGINPMLAFSGSAPSAPSVGSHSVNSSNTDVASDNRWDPMALSAISVNSAQVRSLDNQGKAALLNAETNKLKAESDIRRNDAETALRVLEKARYESGANYDNPHIRDAYRALNHAFDAFGSSWDYFSDNATSRGFDSLLNYVKHGPSKTPLDINVRHKLDSLFDDITKVLPLRGLDSLVRPQRYKRKGSYIHSR